MLRIKFAFMLAGTALVLSLNPDVAAAQGKGKGKGAEKQEEKGRGAGKSQDKVRGPSAGKGSDQVKERGRVEARGNDKDKDKSSKGNASANAGKRKNFVRVASRSSMPQSVRRYADSRHPGEVMLAAAVSHAYARGRGDEVRVVPVGSGVRLTNRRGDELVYLDDERARDLGTWRAGVIGDDVREGAPSFCRSGAGHPVWGRQWCLDKGFGIGSYEDYRWARTDDPGNIIFSRTGIGDRIVGSALAGLLGNSAFDRLALHAVTLGLVEPLVGRWVADQGGPQLLLVNSGTYPVAEVVDVNRDNRVDDILFALRSW